MPSSDDITALDLEHSHEQVRAIYLQSPAANLAIIAVGVLYFLFLKNQLPPAWLGLWAVALMTGAMVRYRLWYLHRNNPQSDSPQRWLRRYFHITLFMGLAWGAVYLLPDDPENTLVLAALVLLYLGLTLSAHAILSVHLPLYFVYTLPSAFALMMLLMDFGSREYYWLAGAVAVFTLFMALASFNASRNLHRTIQLQVHNRDLIARLEKEVRQRDRLVADKTALLVGINEELTRSEDQLSNVISGANLGYWDWDYQTGYHEVNDRWLEILGLTRADINNDVSDWSARIHPEDEQRMIDTVQHSIQHHQPYTADFRMRHQDGHWVWIQGSGAVVEYDNATGDAKRLCGTHMDISDRKQAEQDLLLAASVFSHAGEGIIITDLQGSILDVNQAFTQITSYLPADVKAQHPAKLLSSRHDESFFNQLREDLRQHGRWNGELWAQRKSGELFPVAASINAVSDSVGELQHFVTLFTDITRQKQQHEQLEYIAHYDPLTRLPNRVLLADRLDNAIHQVQRRKRLLAVAYLDLDGFKNINDEHGHAVGDQVLVQVAGRMKESLREGDTIARIGGDEFVAVLIDLEEQADCLPLIERLLSAASHPVYLDNLMMQVSASIGVTFYPQTETLDAEQLLSQADQAMYQAKLNGKNRYQLFAPVSR